MASRILLLEQNRPLAKAIGARLGQHYEVEHQADANSALQSIRATPPDLLLLELKLSGLHGIELLRTLRKDPATAQLPVVIMTGFYKGEKFARAAKALGVHAYLEKPLKAGNLLSAIEQALKGSIEQATASDVVAPRPFAQLLRSAFLKEFSGLLTLTYPDTVRLLTFINGAPVALRPGFISRDFGDFLCRRGQISADEYDYFSTTAAYRHGSLVQIGCLHYPELLQAELEYLNEELIEAFGAGPARPAWKVIPAPELLQLITLNVPQLFYDGFHRHAGDAAQELLATFAERYILLEQGYYRHINFLRLNEAEKRFVQTIDGRHRLKELGSDCRDAGPLLLTLTNLNMARFSREPAPSAAPRDLPLRTLFNVIDDAQEATDSALENFDDLVDNEQEAVQKTEQTSATDPAQGTAQQATGDDELSQEVRLIAASLEGKNHYEVFGIKPARFTIELLKERYFAITRKFGPEVLMQLGGEEATLVEQILSTVATAYDTPSEVVKKERYDEMLGADKVGLGHKGDDRFQAQVQAESGKVFLQMEEWDNAEKALQEAVNSDPDNGDYLASLGWAIYRNPRYAGSQAMLNKARQMLNRSIAMERTADAFAYKGWILLETGQEAMAESEFSKALKLDARQALARRGLRTLRENQEEQKKGLFRKMFR
jgi:CheY-like chemotaxis protein